MINTSIDQLLKLFVPRHEDGFVADEPRHVGPPFDTHLRQARSDELSAPANSSPRAETSRRDLEPGRSADVEPPANRSAESNTRPAQSSATRESDEPGQRDDAANDTQDAQPPESDQSDDAAAAAADGPPTQPGSTVRDEADPTSAGETPSVEHSPDDENAVLAENAEPQVERRNGRLVETRRGATGAENDAAAEPGSAAAEARVRPAADDSAVASNDPAPSAKPRPDARDQRPTDARETAIAADELTAADADAARPNHRRGALQERETKSIERDGRQSASPHASERAGDRSAVSGTAVADLAEDNTASAGNRGHEVDDSGQRDESPTESRSQSGRARPAGGARTIAVQNIVAVSAEAKLTAAGAGLPSDATSESDAKRTAGSSKDGLLATFGRFDRHGPLGGRGVHSAADGQEMPHVDPARFVSRVARAIQTAHERGGPLQLRLSPPELGSLRLELSVKQGVLTASVETDTATARQLLLENLPTLRDRLAEQNVRIERFDVDVRRDGGGEQPRFGPQHQEHQHQGHSAPPGRGANQHGPGGGDAAAAAPLPRAITDTSINVIA